MYSPDDSDDIATCLSNEVIQWIDPLNNRKIYHVWTHPDGIKHLKMKENETKENFSLETQPWPIGI